MCCYMKSVCLGTSAKTQPPPQVELEFQTCNCIGFDAEIITVLYDVFYNVSEQKMVVVQVIPILVNKVILHQQKKRCHLITSLRFWETCFVCTCLLECVFDGFCFETISLFPPSHSTLQGQRPPFKNLQVCGACQQTG